MNARGIFDRAATVLGDVVFDFRDAARREAGAKELKEGPRDACFQARPERIADLMHVLRDDPELAFDFLQNLTAIDWLKRGVFEVVYHLFSYRHRHSTCVKVNVPRETPRLPTVTGVWPTANWLEREQFDLLGVVFEGHPDLRRLLMPDDWIGHPMRKDFHEPKSYRGMPTSRPSPMDLLATYDRAHAASATGATPPTGAAGKSALPASGRPPGSSGEAS